MAGTQVVDYNGFTKKGVLQRDVLNFASLGRIWTIYIIGLQEG